VAGLSKIFFFFKELDLEVILKIKRVLFFQTPVYAYFDQSPKVSLDF
jgi:hypothetical protein